jgi:dTDP-4-dehydrorhamnose 3,5-epimerase-like enzyme
MEGSQNIDWVAEPIIKLNKPFIDERGKIQNLISLNELQSVVIIESKKDTIRANHYHKTDWHYCYVMSGSIDYYSRKVDSDNDPVLTKIKSGDLFYTPHLVEHAMHFTKDTVFLTLGGGTRSHDDYESDLVRVKLI